MTNLSNYKLEGEFLKIYEYPAAVLKKIAKPVEKFDEDLKTLVKNMLYTMYKAPGIGLAAPQIGKSIRLFVMDINFNREEVIDENGEKTTVLSGFNPLIIINPKFTLSEGEYIYEEGCLSVPGIYENVKRSLKVVVNYQDIDGNPQTIEAEELLAVCLQHENDHLDGIVFLERLSMLKRNFLTKKYLKKHKTNK